MNTPPPAPSGDTPPPTEILPTIATATVLAEVPGQKIGRYKLLQKIGEGGCGVVYMAEQEEPVRRRVALKVIKLGMDTREVVLRFEAERQALARMDHLNIARVFDAGSTATGRPYFVMELVRGVPLTRYCDENNLPTDERLRLFNHVCHAVQHAHQKGIIHRDLKPSNILVTLHDGVPVPKVIDFGIAKATQGRLTDATLFTAFEQFVGTPAYMSPEQAELSGLDVDTRSDVYSLGILLYELLTGRTPFDTKELLQAGLDEIRRHIREVEPPRPSTRLSTLQGEALSTAARQRGLAAPKLVNLIRGDLDWIVMRCLEKDRSRRYETASNLALDLTRYLNDEPVSARPPSRFYRLQKLVRRNRLVTATVATVVIALLGGLAFSTWSFFQEKAARHQAQTAAKKSEQITQFLQNMLGGARPSVALGKDTTLLRELMDRTVARLGRDLKDQPEVEASLRTTLGGVYFGLGDLGQAEAMQREAIALRRASGSSPEASLYQLALVLNARGDLAGAESALRETLRIRRARAGAPADLVAGTLNDLACVVRARGDPAEATALFRTADEQLRRAHSFGSLAQVTILNNLAAVAHARGDAPAALEAERGAQANLQTWSSTSLAAAAGRGVATTPRPTPPEVAAALADGISLRTWLLDGASLETAWSRQNLAALLLAFGDVAGAEMLGREALQMTRHIAGRQSREAAAALAFLTSVLLEGKKFAAAEPLARECLALRETLQPDDWRTAHARSLVGAALLGQQKFGAAGPLVLRGAEELSAQAPAIFPSSSRRFLGLALQRAAQLCDETGDLPQAAAWRRKLAAIPTTEAAHPPAPAQGNP